MLLQLLSHFLQTAKPNIRNWVKPDNYVLPANIAADLTRSRAELILENAFLRQQLIILDRLVKRPMLRPREGVLLVLIASRLKAWKQALLIVQPDTLIRWHRDLYRWLWKRKSQSSQKPGRKPLLRSVVELIQRMARENRTGQVRYFL
jgi:putative transposase